MSRSNDEHSHSLLDILSNRLCPLTSPKNCSNVANAFQYIKTNMLIMCQVWIDKVITGRERDRERERVKTYKIRLVCVVDNGCASEERDDDNHARPGQRWSPRRLFPPSKFLIHHSKHHPSTTKVVYAYWFLKPLCWSTPTKSNSKD